MLGDKKYESLILKWRQEMRGLFLPFLLLWNIIGGNWLTLILSNFMMVNAGMISSVWRYVICFNISKFFFIVFILSLSCILPWFKLDKWLKTPVSLFVLRMASLLYTWLPKRITLKWWNICWKMELIRALLLR